MRKKLRDCTNEELKIYDIVIHPRNNLIETIPLIKGLDTEINILDTRLEIEKLKDKLKDAQIPFYTRESRPTDSIFYYQIVLLNKNGEDLADVIQTSGFNSEFLEIYGAMTEEETNYENVLNHLTADDVFERFLYCYRNNTSIYKEKR